MDTLEKVPVQRVTLTGSEYIEDIVIVERPLTIIFNNEELVTLICSPVDLRYLAVGFLASEGLLQSRDQIKKTTVDEQKSIVRIETSEQYELAGELIFKRMITPGCGRGASLYSVADAKDLATVQSDIKITAPQVFNLVKEFQNRSEVFKETGGVHSAAFCDAERILIFKEDIGRHNAIDKIIGECIINDIPTKDHILLTSGRVSSEIILKVIKRNIPLLISRSAPTSTGVKLANDLGVTLIGFVRGTRMNVYTHSQRILSSTA